MQRPFACVIPVNSFWVISDFLRLTDFVCLITSDLQNKHSGPHHFECIWCGIADGSGVELLYARIEGAAVRVDAFLEADFHFVGFRFGNFAFFDLLQAGLHAFFDEAAGFRTVHIEGCVADAGFHANGFNGRNQFLRMLA